MTQQLSTPPIDFPHHTAQEFIQHSGISPALYRSTTRVVSDVEPLPGGDVDYPIHESLNWHLTRFGNQARATLQAVLLQNEDHSTWQAKLNRPLLDKTKGKPRKYETPIGNGSRALLSAIPPEIRQLIAQRHNVNVPLDGSFWEWLQTQPQLPIIITEGGKKALCLLSQGHIAIALYGVNGGYRKLLHGIRELIPDLQRFCQPERQIVLAFDQDESQTTRKRVALALNRFGWLLSHPGCVVTIAQWDRTKGKGVDDLVVTHGIEAWEKAESEALPLLQWQLLQRLQNRLTYPTAIKLTTADLSTLELADLPQQGMIGIASGKGTGKTKFIGKAVAGFEKVLAAGHRVALMRNLSERLGLDYKGDLDKVNGDFITGSAYTLRIGFCVDSLLWFDPTKFVGCDLVLDEVVQVIRHLLTSSTCAKDGKRPALIARFHELIRVARRVIVADADLNNATLQYLQKLREDDTPVFLIRNDYQAKGYEARFIQSPDRTAITHDLLQAIGELERGKVLVVATDSKATSRILEKATHQKFLDKRVLLINSITSGEEDEQAFMKQPDFELTNYDVIIGSPSVATGVSIEAQGMISAVYGIFMGVSSTDADMAQSLMRVREPVPRVIWCAKQGSNYNKVSHSLNPLEINQHLREQTSATISLIRCSLREDLVAGFDWNTDPHIHLYCELAAEQNLSMRYLREALLVRLRSEGHTVVIEDRESVPAMKLLLNQARQELREMDAEDLVAVEDLTYTEVMALEQKEGLSSEEHLAVAKFHLKEFYGLESLTVEDVLQDNEGRRRGELLNLETQLFPGLAVERTVRALEKQAGWNQGLCPWDISYTELRRQLRERIGLNELIAKMRSGWRWTKYDLKPYADKARALALQIKVALHLTIDKMSDTQIVHQLLSQLGIKVSFNWSRGIAGHEGEKLRVHKLNQDHWESVWAVLQRRAVKREQIQQQADSQIGGLETGSPVGLKGDKRTDDPVQGGRNHESELAELLSEACLADVRGMIEAAEGDTFVLAAIKEMYPQAVLARVGLI